MRQWLESFNITEEEPMSILWSEYLMKFVTIILKFQNKSKTFRNNLLTLIFYRLYLNYDLDKAFLLQFKENCEFVLKTLQNIETELEAEEHKD